MKGLNAERVQKIRRMLAGYLPPVLWLVRSVRRPLAQRRERRMADKLRAIKQRFTGAHGWMVQSGPFRGLKYPATGWAMSVVPRLVGCYEAEIQPSLEAALQRQPSVIVDVGCEEGYYAVGFALRQPSATVYAFDIDTAAQEACKEMARLNEVEDRVRVKGECTPANLNELLTNRAFVLCDCEGFEINLLDPSQAPSLCMADILVELHDHVRTDLDITPTLLARFAPTHEITLIDRQERDPSLYSNLSMFSAEDRLVAVYETRMPYQQWAFLKAKRRTM